MKAVCIENPWLAGLARHLRSAGHELVPFSIQADCSFKLPIVLPHVSLSMYPKVSTAESQAYAVRWFDGERFNDQTLVAIPLRGVISGNRGASVESGMVARYFDNRPVVNRMFDESRFAECLKGFQYTGLATIGFTIDQDPTITLLQSSTPSCLTYNFCEGFKDDLVQLASAPSLRFMESWTASLVVSRYPWPLMTDFTNSYPVEGVSEELERHFYLFRGRIERKVYRTVSTIIGVATAWHHELRECCDKLLWSVRHIKAPEIQYREDAFEVALEGFAMLREAEIV